VPVTILRIHRSPSTGISGHLQRNAQLSRLVLELPTESLLQELDETLSHAPVEPGLPLADEMAALAHAVAHARTRGDTVSLCAEHTRLWGGLSPAYGPPPPYESVIREGRLPGDATTAAAAYAAADVDPELPDAGPVDHLAVELRFVALCCLREADAWRSANAAEATAWLQREQSFLEQHLLQWATKHCTAVASLARDDYHRTVAQLIPLACELDRNDLDWILHRSSLQAPHVCQTGCWANS
jgi:TorA maturation chaperone TorD